MDLEAKSRLANFATRTVARNSNADSNHLPPAEFHGRVRMPYPQRTHIFAATFAAPHQVLGMNTSQLQQVSIINDCLIAESHPWLQLLQSTAKSNYRTFRLISLGVKHTQTVRHGLPRNAAEDLPA